MARVIAVCNQKGGVGKTTTSVNLAGYLVASGKKTLVIDFDPQANASSALGGNAFEGAPSVYHGLVGEHTMADVVRETALPGLSLAPASPHLAGSLVELVHIPEREFRLRRVLAEIRHNYDYILIDLPPSLSLLTVNGLVAADEVLIPVQAEYYSLEGIGQLLQTVQLVRENLRHPLRVAGAVITMYDKRERLAREVARNLRSHFPHKIYNTEIPRSVALAEAPSFGVPVVMHAPESVGAMAYRRLAEEVIAEESREHIDPHFGNFNI